MNYVDKVPKSVYQAQKEGFRVFFIPEEALGIGHWEYQIECEACGRQIRFRSFNKNIKKICQSCKNKRRKYESIYDKALENALIETGVIDKYKIRFQKAVKELEENVVGIEKYKKAIQMAETRCEKYGSIPEAMVAIQLIYMGYKIIPQQKIAGYTVDFVIPEKEWVIEVDGMTYHNISEIGGFRDVMIQECIGHNYKVIHIPAEYIRKNITKLGKLIKNYKIP